MYRDDHTGACDRPENWMYIFAPLLLSVFALSSHSRNPCNPRSIAKPNCVRCNRNGLPIHGGLFRLVSRIEDNGLSTSAAGPEAIELAIVAFKSGEQRSERFQPIAIF